MTRTLPPELFSPQGVWLLAVAPLGVEITTVVRQVVRTGTEDDIYVPVFSSMENAQTGIGWLSPTDPDELIPFSFSELPPFLELLSALAILGHAYLVIDPDSANRGERIAIREITRAIQRHLNGPRK